MKREKNKKNQQSRTPIEFNSTITHPECKTMHFF